MVYASKTTEGSKNTRRPHPYEKGPTWNSSEDDKKNCKNVWLTSCFSDKNPTDKSMYKVLPTYNSAKTYDYE